MKLYRNIKDNHIYRIYEVNATKHIPRWYVAMPHFLEMGTCATYDDLEDFIFMQDTELKLCKDCKFFKQQALLDVCENPIFPKRMNVVNGTYHTNYCCHLRMKNVDEKYGYGLCGTEAKYFEKCPSFTEALIGIWKSIFGK